MIVVARCLHFNVIIFLLKHSNGKRALMWMVGVVIVIIVAFLLFRNNSKIVTIAPVACTEEAKLCPDGSSVGRTGPQCQFAECPNIVENTNTEVKDGKSNTTPIKEVESNFSVINKKIYNNGIHITPTEIMEDSRCPKDVNCIWAGTFRLKIKLESETTNQVSEISMTNSVVFEGKTITLVSVSPEAVSGQKIDLNAYRFEFKVNGKSVTPVSSGNIIGTITIGPVCPVERVDNPCKPTPAMYAERKVSIYKTDGRTLVVTLTPDANGKFSASLPKGNYYVDMEKFVGKPATASGVPTNITIQEGGKTYLDINIDTGIR